MPPFITAIPSAAQIRALLPILATMPPHEAATFLEGLEALVDITAANELAQEAIRRGALTSALTHANAATERAASSTDTLSALVAIGLRTSHGH